MVATRSTTRKRSAGQEQARQRGVISSHRPRDVVCDGCGGQTISRRPPNGQRNLCPECSQQARAEREKAKYKPHGGKGRGRQRKYIIPEDNPVQLDSPCYHCSEMGKCSALVAEGRDPLCWPEK